MNILLVDDFLLAIVKYSIDVVLQEMKCLLFPVLLIPITVGTQSPDVQLCTASSSLQPGTSCTSAETWLQSLTMTSSPRLDVVEYLNRSYGSCLTLVESFLLSGRQFDDWLQNDRQAPVSI
jgi:hypothetical protein